MLKVVLEELKHLVASGIGEDGNVKELLELPGPLAMHAKLSDEPQGFRVHFVLILQDYLEYAIKKHLQRCQRGRF